VTKELTGFEEKKAKFNEADINSLIANYERRRKAIEQELHTNEHDRDNLMSNIKLEKLSGRISESSKNILDNLKNVEKKIILKVNYISTKK